MESERSTPSAGASEGSLHAAAADARDAEARETRVRIARILAPLFTFVAVVALPAAVVTCLGPLSLADTDVVGACALSGACYTAVVVAAVLLRRARRLRGAITRSGLRWVAILGGGVWCMVLLTTWAVIKVGVHHEWRVARLAFEAQFARHQDAFLVERAQASQLPLFAGIGRDHDAGPILNTLIPWYVTWDARISGDGAVGGSSLLTLPEPFSKAFNTMDIPNAVPFVKDLDTSWMSALHGSDHWDIDAGSPRASARPFGVAASPLPKFALLWQWSAVRAVQAYDKGGVDELRAARDDIRLLARLCASSDTLLGMMIGARILQDESKLRAAVVARGDDIDLAWWTPPGDGDLKLVRRVAWAEMAYGNPYAPSSSWDVLDGSSQLDCIGLYEGLAEIRSARELLERDAPARLVDAKARVAALSRRCHFHKLVEEWDSAPPSTGSGCDDLDAKEWLERTVCPLDFIATWVPGTSDDVGRYFSVTCGPSADCGFSQYDDLAKQ